MSLLRLLVFVLLASLSLAGDKLRVCYYSNWSQYRNGAGKFLPSNIDASLCTHLIYSFSKINSQNELATYEWNDETLYKQFNALKQTNPALKTLLATGGWNAGSTVYSDMVTNPTLRRNFAKQSIEFVRNHGFDGFDLDWEYPALRGGRASDKANFIELIKDLKVEIAADAARNPTKSRLLLTAAVAAGKDNIDAAYDIPAMAKHLDFINLMSYDLHGGWETFTGHNSPLYSRAGEDVEQSRLNIDWAARYWIDGGCPKEKLIIGLATYGRNFQLTDPTNSGFGAPVRGAGSPGPMTGESGFLAYYEVCAMLAAGAQRMWHPEHKVPYLVSGNQWVGYDDEESIKIKLNYINSEGYGGAMVWNIDLDDFNQQCSLSTRRYPLMSLMREVLGGYTPPSTQQPNTNSTGRTTKEQTDATTGTTSGVTDNPEKVFTCVGKSDGFYRDPASCGRYYQCWSGTQYHSACPSGLYWNQEHKYCDYPSNVDCSETTTDEPETSLKTTSTSTSSSTSELTTSSVGTSTTETTETTRETSVTTERPTSETEDPNNFCATKSNGLYKKMSECSEFYQCSEGQTFVFKCPKGTLYNAESKICDWAENVDCGSHADQTDFCTGKSDGLYTYPSDCSKYYNCGSGNTYIVTCAAGLYWSPKISNCDWIANVDCGDRPLPAVASSLGNICSDGNTASHLHVDPSSCHNFIRCAHGSPHHDSCGNYLKFNPLIGACDWPENVDCVTSVRRGN